MKMAMSDSLKQKTILSLLLASCLSLTAFATIGISDLSDIERDALALELYLLDKKDHEEYCPTLQWEQPSLEIYKEQLISQLPEECKQ